jgi:transposase
MLTFPSTVRIFVCRQNVDLRKSYDGLSGCVEQIIGADPLSGHLFVFFNKRRTQVKILMWDRTGFCIFAKRLERGSFVYDAAACDQGLQMPQLMLILEGIDLRGMRQRKRFHLPEKNEIS